VEAELLPGLRKGERGKVASLMQALPRLEMPDDLWPDVTAIQEKSLAAGVGPFGIPDLLVAATALRNRVAVFTLDRHFEAIAGITGLGLHGRQALR
jgi:predicted nucleic acid-binding protein